MEPFHLLDRIATESGQGWTFYDILDFMEKLARHCVSDNVNHSGNFEIVLWMAF